MLTLMTLLIAKPEIPLVLLNPAEVQAPEVQRLSKKTELGGYTLMGPQEVRKALTGLSEPASASAKELQELLDRANHMGANFDPDAMAFYDRAIGSYDRAIWLSKEMRQLAATAHQDRAAYHFANNAHGRARRDAIETMRRFPDVPIDTLKHAPRVVAIFDRAKNAVEKMPHGALRIEGVQSGEVYIDGYEPRRSRAGSSIKLPVGHYRLWIEEGSQRSLAHEILISRGQTSSVAVTVDLESRLEFSPQLAIRCGSRPECERLLAALAERTGAERAVGIEHVGGITQAFSVTQSGKVQRLDLSQEVLSSSVAVPSHEFSSLYLAPLGVGQIAQERYAAGSIYGAVQLGLLAWNLQANAARGDAEPNDPEFDRLTRNQNLSAGLFYGALAASILESVLVWAIE